MCSHPVVAIHPAVGACVVHHRGELLSPLGVSDPGSDGLLQVADVEPDVIPLEFPPRFQYPTQSLGSIVAANDDRETGEVVDTVQFDGRGVGGDCDVQLRTSSILLRKVLGSVDRLSTTISDVIAPDNVELQVITNLPLCGRLNLLDQLIHVRHLDQSE